MTSSPEGSSVASIEVQETRWKFAEFSAGEIISNAREGGGFPVDGLRNSGAKEFWPHAKSMKVSPSLRYGFTTAAILDNTR